jgi:hypothetical protein
MGYGDGEGLGLSGLPGLDWRVILQFDPPLVNWIVPSQLPTKRFNFVRIAVPARTTRHLQAAVHTLWSPGTLHAKDKRTIFYGFRNLNGVWKLVARSKER